VLFRPEDIALAAKVEELDCSQLGQGEVEEISYVGSFERLRLRLPPIPGVRPISPPVPFGNRSILVEATRSPEQAKRYPLQPGEKAWVGIHNIHTLTHPGLNFLLLSDGSLRAQAAVTLGGQIARLAHARVTLVGYGAGEASAEDEDVLQAHLQEARKELGSGLAALEVLTFSGPSDQAVFRAIERDRYDLVILGFNFDEDQGLAEEILLGASTIYC
jgi:sulfate transport system ATP-binding protein